MPLLALSVLVIDKSACGAIGLVAVLVLLPPVGSVVPLGAETVATLVSVPDALLESVAVKANVAVPLAAKLTVALMLPEPLGVPQLDPAEAVQVHVALLSELGRLSTTVAPVTALGPLLVTTML